MSSQYSPIYARGPTTAAVTLTEQEILALQIVIDRYEALVQDAARRGGYATTNQGMIDIARSAAQKISASFGVR